MTKLLFFFFFQPKRTQVFQQVCVTYSSIRLTPGRYWLHAYIPLIPNPKHSMISPAQLWLSLSLVSLVSLGLPWPWTSIAFIGQSLCCVLSCFSHVQLFVTLWTVAQQAPLSMGFSRQEYWSGLPCLSLGDPPDPGIKPASLISSALKGKLFTTSTTNDLSPPLAPPMTSPFYVCLITPHGS